ERVRRAGGAAAPDHRRRRRGGAAHRGPHPPNRRQRQRPHAHRTFSQLDIVEGPFEVAKLRNHLSNAQLNVQVPFGLTGRWPGSWSLSYHHQDSLMFWEGHELPETQKVTGAWEAGVRAATVAGASQWDFGYTLRSVSDQQEGKSYTIHRLSASWRRPVW